MAKTKEEIMLNWAKQINLDESVVHNLIEKYGEELAHTYMLEALMRPTDLYNSLEDKPKKPTSKSLILHLAKTEETSSKEAIKNDMKKDASTRSSGTPKASTTPSNNTNLPADREHIKYSMKEDRLRAEIILENGKFTSQIRQEIIDELTPIYGVEYAEKLYNLAISKPSILHGELANKPSSTKSRHILQHLLTVKDNSEIEDIKDAASRCATYEPNRFDNSNYRSSSRGGYEVGGYTAKMPYDLAIAAEERTFTNENNTSRHYLCAAGYLTNIGVTNAHYPEEYKEAFGAQTTDLLSKAQEVAQSNALFYSTDNGNTWTRVSTSVGNYHLTGLQSKVEYGTCLICNTNPQDRYKNPNLSDKKRNEGIIELERIEGGGFYINKVEGKTIATPNMDTSRALNLRVLDKNYQAVKKFCGEEYWNSYTIEKQADLVYSYYHNPKKTENAITYAKNGGPTMLPTGATMTA